MRFVYRMYLHKDSSSLLVLKPLTCCIHVLMLCEGFYRSREEKRWLFLIFIFWVFIPWQTSGRLISAFLRKLQFSWCEGRRTKSQPPPNPLPPMPICVECDAPVATLYTEYSKGNIRLTSCVSHSHD
jgi:hypothetical protein